MISKEDLHSTFFFLYNISIFPIIFISFFYYFFFLYHFFISKNKNKIKINYFPKVSIHIPVYNDRVVYRAIESALNQDYPKDKYEIIVIDDSTDIETRKIIDKYKDKIKILRRNERRGFKAGALNDALKISNGEIIVVLDSDWKIPKNFLKRIVQHFKDEKVAIVQSKMIIENFKKSAISKFASILQSIYYLVLMPIYNFNNTAFCAGGGSAIRKKVLEEVNGWNEKSITEDADLSIKVLLKGYKIVYDDKIYGKALAPEKLQHFLKQQARWTFGLTKTYIENFRKIWFSNLSLIQKILITVNLFGHAAEVFVSFFILTSFLSWITGGPKPFDLFDFYQFLITFALTSGFLISCIYISTKAKICGKIETIFLTIFIGSVTALNNTINFLKAFFVKRAIFVVTPKS